MLDRTWSNLVILTAFLCLSLWCLSWYSTSTPAGTPIYWTQTLSLNANYIVVTSNNASEWPPYRMDELAPWDYHSLIDLEDFNFIEKSQPCNKISSIPPLLLVLVHSAPNNTYKRNAIRETWGAKTLLGDEQVILRFMLGTVENEDVQDILKAEARKYQDIVQGSFKDAYRNLTYKHVMTLKWASYFCPTAKYVLKTDDDVLINMPLFLRFLIHDLSPAGVRRLILCPINKFALPKRSYRSKWRVSWKDYSEKYYPPYCLGYIVLYSPDVIFRLYMEAQRSEYFWIDDVHVTGTLLKRANLEHTELSSLILNDAQVQAILNGYNFRPDSFLFGNPDMDVYTIRKLWARLKEVSDTTWPPP